MLPVDSCLQYGTWRIIKEVHVPSSSFHYSKSHNGTSLLLLVKNTSKKLWNCVCVITLPTFQDHWSMIRLMSFLLYNKLMENWRVKFMTLGRRATILSNNMNTVLIISKMTFSQGWSSFILSRKTYYSWQCNERKFFCERIE